MSKSKLHKFDAKLSVDLFKEREVWIAHCKTLDLGSQGTTMKEAKEMFQEALDLYTECMERGGRPDKTITCSSAPVNNPDSVPVEGGIFSKAFTTVKNWYTL